MRSVHRVRYACEDDFVLVDHKFICIWCVSEKFLLCPHCCDFFPAEKMVSIHGYFVCKECLKDYFKECKICHNSCEKDEMTDAKVDGNYEEICFKCWHENYFNCDDCGCTYPKKESCNYQGKLFCEDCFRQTVSDDILDGTLTISVLKNWNNKVSPRLPSGRSGSVSSASYSPQDSEAFFAEGYPDDYLGDGLDGKDDYLGDGLDE